MAKKTKKVKKDPLDQEMEEMSLKPGQKPLKARIRKGRPMKPETVKTNLDLTPELISELDEIAEFLGSSRQAVIKVSILNFLVEHRKSKKSA